MLLDILKMAELLTFIARASDGLILSETWDAGEPQQSEIVHKQEAKKIIARLANAPQRCSVDSDLVTFHYVVESGICYLTMVQRNYPKRLAFGFLEEVARAFLEELKRSLGTSVDFRSYIDTITKPYSFITFDRVIQKKRQEFKDPMSNKAMSKVTEGLAEVNTIMRQSLEDMLKRGEALEDVGRKADDLKEASKKFSKQAKYLNFQAMMRKYGIFAFLVFVLLFIIWYRFF